MSGDILTTHAVRLGLRQIDGFSEEWGKKIESVRGRGFDSVRDLWLRTGLPPKALQKLAHADAFNSLGLSRRDALWAVKALQKAGDKDNLPLFARVSMPALEPDAHLPSMLPGEQVIEDYRHLHLSLKAHPVSFLRRDFDARGIVRHDLLPTLSPGRRVTIGGHRAGAPAARHRQRHLHDAGGRNRHRQHHHLAAQVRAVSSGGDGLAADQRDRRSAERERRHPHRRRSFRGSDASARAAVGAWRPHRYDHAARRDQAAGLFTPAPSALRRCAGHDAEGADGPGDSEDGFAGRPADLAQVMPKGRNFH